MENISKLINTLFAYIGLTYSFLTPKSMEEIEEDAKTLRHAGAVYAKGALRNERDTLQMIFMRPRNNTNTPHITLGIYDEKEIRIAVGQNNRRLTEGEYRALENYASNVGLTINLAGYCAVNYPKVDLCDAIKEFAENIGIVEEPVAISENVGIINNMETKNYKEVELSSRMQIVITRIDRQFDGAVDADAIIGMLNKAGRALLGLTKDIKAKAVVLGNVIVLDVRVPLKTATNRTNGDAFNRAVVSNLLSKYNRINVGYVSATPTRKVTVTIETELSDAKLKNALANVGSVTIS